LEQIALGGFIVINKKYRYMNLIILLGNVGKDVEVRNAGNTKCATFSIATNETWKDKNGEKKQDTQWHNIVVWGALVDVVSKYVKKGDKLLVRGKVVNRSYQDKDGNTKYTSEVIASDIELQGEKSNRDEVVKDSIEVVETKSEDFIEQISSDDLPF
jgi:single-strand DNA-binding protein